MMGPFAPLALSVGGGMMVASKLADASIAAESGAKGISRAMSGGAQKYARRITRGRRGPFAQIMSWGNRKRKQSLARAGGRRSWARFRQQARRRPQPRYRPQPRRGYQPYQPQRFAQYARQAQQMIPRWSF
jgi:hypothetical protein